MGYIVKEVFSGFTPTVKDSFNGDNSTTAFTLSKGVNLSTDVEEFVDNIQQEPGSGKAYTVSGTTLTFSEAPPTGTGNVYVVHRNSLQGSLLPPQDLGSKNYNISGNLSLDKDSAVLNFGADSDINLTHVADVGLTTNNDFSLKSDGAVLKFGSDEEITLTHSADAGLLLKHAASGDDKFPTLTLQTGDTDIAQNDVLGQINFQAPDEGTDTDSRLVASTIKAFSEGNFAADNNATTLELSTGRSATSGSDGGRLRLTSAGVLELKNQNTADESKPVFHIQTGDDTIAQGDSIGVISFSAPDDTRGSDAILVAAQIEALADADFSTSSNKTALVFKTGNTAAASERMRIDSDGKIGVGINDVTMDVGGIHIGDDRGIGFGDGNATRADFQIVYQSSNTRLGIICGTGANTEDIIITTAGQVGFLTAPTGNHTVFSASGATNQQAIAAVGKDSTYATEVMNVFAERAGNSAYSLYKAHSNDNADVEFNVTGLGVVTADGTITGGGADYAEFFEWKDGNSSDEDRVGFTVVLDENKIVKATDSDDTSKIVGVMSARPVILGDGDIERWKYKYLRDDYGREILEEYTVTEWTENDEKVWYETDKIPEDVTVPSDKKVITTEDDGVTKLKRRKLNPSWDKSKTYISREDRKEWGMVGLMGKLRLRKGQPTCAYLIKMIYISDTV